MARTLDVAPNPSRFRMHTHTTVELYIFLQGNGVFHIEGSAYPLKPGDLLVMAPAESHCIAVDVAHPYERLVLNFSPDFFHSIDPQNILMQAILNRKPGKFNCYHSSELPDCHKHIQAMINPDGDPRMNLLSGLLPLLTQLNRVYMDRNDTPEPDTAEYKIIRYINKNLAKPITLDLLCDQFFISKSQLCRLFKRSTGTTVGHYITVKRLMKAKQLLESGERPTHVFSRCGFNDYSVFYRAYVKHFGHAPADEPHT